MIAIAQSPGWVRPRTIVFAVIVAMMAYVLYNNERFLIDPSHPVWSITSPSNGGSCRMGSPGLARSSSCRCSFPSGCAADIPSFIARLAEFT